MKRWLFLSLISLWLLGGTNAPAQVYMEGDIGYYFSQTRVYIYIEHLTNYGDTRTDRLRLRMWASEHHWQPNRRGRRIAFTLLPRLGPHEERDDVDPDRPFNRPPSGWYYLTLTVEERTFDENGEVRWVIRDAVEFDHQHYFHRWHNPWPPFPF